MLCSQFNIDVLTESLAVRSFNDGSDMLFAIRAKCFGKLAYSLADVCLEAIPSESGRCVKGKVCAASHQTSDGQTEHVG